MLHLFRLANGKNLLVRKSKVGKIHENSIESEHSYEDGMKLYEEYRKKSIEEDIYYLKGSKFMKMFLKKFRNVPHFYHFFINHFNRLDQKEPRIPLDIGLKIEELISTKEAFLGMHRSDSILGKPVLEDKILYAIMREGLIDNGAAMQGAFSSYVSPSQTVSPANDPILAIDLLKTSFRGSSGAVLVLLPRKYINGQFDLLRNVDPKCVFQYDEKGICYIKPEFIVGYIHQDSNGFQFYSREEILANHPKRGLS